ncbi:hypothetical protein FLL45_02825 [Aliikangiella marina]|uniref:Uncharacterized protein n=1 Tax=Aliikangiella marina TaxID=1712262 RepID=A0A545TI67_9GAMM|nr:hypothetical protein [Aliikangiella marina]TQV76903.1 hypothetical protein FLL45_02825 [Aliikangiella marina]
MKWYTLENGRLCLGTDKNRLANFHIATDVTLEANLSLPLLEEHVELIGSYPEDWYSDDTIENKINNTAKHFFGLSQTAFA